jgi:hypothetical protein
MQRAAAAVLFVLACALGACGSSSSSGSAPQGNPAARHGSAAVDSYAAVELLRARLTASSDSYYAGGSADDARRQLASARGAYERLAPRVRAKDRAVDREVTARLDLLARDLQRGVAPDHYRDLATPLADQLMDGVEQALVPEAARSDRGVQAEALRRVTNRLAATYDAASTGVDRAVARQAYEESWGLWRRAQALTALIKANLGEEASTVSGELNDLRGSAFKDGPTMPGSLPAAANVDGASTKVIAAVTKRFGLGAL